MAGYRQNSRRSTSGTTKSAADGDWSAFVEQIFEEWDYGKNVVEPFPILVSWNVWPACDDGFRAAACILYFAQDRDLTGTIYVIAEIWARQQTPEMLAPAIRQIGYSLPIYIGGEVIANDCLRDDIVDSVAFSDNGQGSRTNEMNRIHDPGTLCLRLSWNS